MKKSKHLEKFFAALGHYAVFFLLVAFVITCCMTLFLNLLSNELEIVFSEENIALAAKVTFWNVIFISLLFTIIDTVRRKITVERHVKRISEAAQRLVQGDFSVRIPTSSGFAGDNRFNEIIESFNHMASELSGVETLRTDFIANVSHEMKTPLAVMQNYGTLLQTPGLDEKTRIEYAKTVTDASRRLSDMMTNILKLNRLENQKIYPKAEKFDLGEQLCECLLGFESVWEKRGIEIETNIETNTQLRKEDETAIPVVWPEGQVPITGGRPGRSEDVADVIVFLASDKSRHITGSPIWVDGGQGLLR